MRVQIKIKRYVKISYTGEKQDIKRKDHLRVEKLEGFLISDIDIRNGYFDILLHGYTGILELNKEKNLMPRLVDPLYSFLNGEKIIWLIFFLGSIYKIYLEIESHRQQIKTKKDKTNNEST